METTDKPFPDALLDALAEREMSLRELARRCRRDGWGDEAGSTLSRLTRRQMEPTMTSMEAIARGLEVPPDYFAEYRLERVRVALDWRVQGVKPALRTLRELTG